MSTVYRPKWLKTEGHLSAILIHVNSVAAKTSEDDFSQMNPEQKLDICKKKALISSFQTLILMHALEFCWQAHKQQPI